MSCFENSSATFTKVVAILRRFFHSHIHLQVVVEKYDTEIHKQKQSCKVLHKVIN